MKSLLSGIRLKNACQPSLTDWRSFRGGWFFAQSGDTIKAVAETCYKILFPVYKMSCNFNQLDVLSGQSLSPRHISVLSGKIIGRCLTIKDSDCSIAAIHIDKN
jgi:hypothetical protein